MSTLLSVIEGADFALLEQGYKIGLDWLGQFARVIIEGIGILGLGIIVFTLVLKAITLPFDIYQRVKMRKQTLIMKQMQPELEKLQKQYANDKTMYNQKMMELYKKNGYSMLGACLPMIISLVILIVAFQGFRAYSSYANLKMYVDMSEQYNTALAEYIVDGKDYHLPVEGEDPDELTIDWEGEKSEGNLVYTRFVIQTEIMNENNEKEKKDVEYMQVTSTDGKQCVYYIYSLEATNVHREYKLDVDKLQENPEAKKVIDEMVTSAKEANEENEIEIEESVLIKNACNDYLVNIGASAVREWYAQKGNNASFLWIKNVWYPDVSYQHPIQSYSNFIKQFGSTKVTFADGTKRPVTDVMTQERYENLISGFSAETSQANGYFILIILSIGLMVLSQFLSMRSQKESNKYQTVDGSGARTQKIMLIVMPIIYAVFAFMYSAAFSIYMVMSSFVSICVTLLSNLIIGRVFKKKENEAIKEKYTRTLPWMKDDKKYNKKKK